MKQLLRRCAALLLSLSLLLPSAFAVMIPENNVLFTADSVAGAVPQLESALGIAVRDTTGGQLQLKDLEALEEAVNLYSLDLLKELAASCKSKYGVTVSITFCPPSDDGSSAYTLFDPQGASSGTPCVGFYFFLFPRDSAYFGTGTSVSTYLHELTHLAHMVLEDAHAGAALADSFHSLNSGFLYQTEFIQDILSRYEGFDEMSQEALMEFLLLHPEAMNIMEQWSQYLSSRWNHQGRYLFYRQYGTTNLYEDVATIMESLGEDQSVFDLAVNPSYHVLTDKYAAIASAFRSRFAAAADAPCLSILDDDIPAGWAADSIVRARELGILTGALDGAYDRDITRLEFCRLAVELLEALWGEEALPHMSKLGYDLSSYTFTDVRDDAVTVMAALGVVTGRSSGTFTPNDSIKRSEAARLLALTAAVAGGEDVFDGAGTPLVFADSASFPAWAVTSIDQLSAAGIMNGTGAGFDPDGAYTRQQSTTSLMRLFDYLAA